jgi:hypothetical protein
VTVCADTGVIVAVASKPLGAHLAGTALGPCAHRLDARSIDTVSPRLTLCIRRARTALLATLCNHLLRCAFAVLAIQSGLANFASAAGEARVNAELLACALLARQTGNASCPGSGARLATSGGRRRRGCALAVLAIQSGLANFANTAGEARLNSFLDTLAAFARRPAHTRLVVASACASNGRVGVAG